MTCTYCIVSMNNRELLMRCLDAIAKERESVDFETEVLVLDNASTDGSKELAQEHPTVDRVIALDHRNGKAANDSLLLREAHGEFCLLLNDDSELLPGATAKLYATLRNHPQAALAGAALLDPDFKPQPSAWRLPSLLTALAGAVFVHRRYTVQSVGEQERQVGWAQSAALLVRREAAQQVGYLNPRFFIYSDEVDFAKRLGDAGWSCYYTPSARVIHHEQLKTGAVPERRIVEFSRNRDLYMRIHHGRLQAFAVRLLTAWSYALRAVAAAALPGHSPSRYWRHVVATLFTKRGEGLREAAEHFNRQRQRGNA